MCSLRFYVLFRYQKFLSLISFLFLMILIYISKVGTIGKEEEVS